MAELTGPNLDLTLGVIFVGLLVTGSLFGVTTAQTGWYFAHYPHDRRLLKTLVAAVWLLDTAHLGLYFATIFTYLVQKRAVYVAKEPLPWMSNVQLLCNACAIALIQSFYASRIWTLSKHKLLLAVMALFITGTWIFAIVLFFKTIMTETVSQYVYLAPLDIAMSAMTASTDVLLCCALVFMLATSRTGTQGADRLINKLMIYTVNTGLMTSVYAILSVITVIIVPTTSLFVIFYYIGSRFYTVSLLATLNARLSLRIQAERMGEHTLPEIQVTAQRIPKRSLPDRAAVQRPDIAVSVPYLIATASSTTGGESSIAMTPPPAVHCDGRQCYVLPDGEFGFAYDLEFGHHAALPCSVPESRDGAAR